LSGKMLRGSCSMVARSRKSAAKSRLDSGPRRSSLDYAARNPAAAALETRPLASL
jgi:hypothetical protein